jgi:hypothetical protein
MKKIRNEDLGKAKVLGSSQAMLVSEMVKASLLAEDRFAPHKNE